MTKRKRRGSVGQTMGGMIVGFDYQVFRTTPPPHELVQSARPVTGVSGEDGTEFLVVFPDATDPEIPDGVAGDATPAPADPKPAPAHATGPEDSPAD